MGPHQVAQLEELLPEYRSFGVGRKANLTGEGMVVFYKPSSIQPLETETFWLSETPDVPGSRSWGEGWIRCLAWGRFFHMESGRTFYFFNTHFDTKGEGVRLIEAQLIAEQVAAITGDSPLFLVADFNSPGGESPTWKFFKEKGFKGARDIALSDPKGSFGTWCGFKAPVEHSKRIDWILLKGNIQINGFETINHHRNRRYPSDHFPIIAEAIINQSIHRRIDGKVD